MYGNLIFVGKTMLTFPFNWQKASERGGDNFTYYQRFNKTMFLCDPKEIFDISIALHSKKKKNSYYFVITYQFNLKPRNFVLR